MKQKEEQMKCAEALSRCVAVLRASGEDEVEIVSTLVGVLIAESIRRKVSRKDLLTSVGLAYDTTLLAFASLGIDA